MRIDWVQRKDKGVVIVFFNGWGMDSRSVSHLRTDSDWVVCSDYRSLKPEGGVPDFSSYHTLYVVAWSMGVWAAANVLPEWEVHPDRLVALNGTERPVDDLYGIPVRSYVLTENGMTERGREKFFARMFADRREAELFSVNKPRRILTEQVEELRLIHKLSSEHKKCIKWDKIYISEKDLIFPPANQRRWWEGKAPVASLVGGHYPFYNFTTWKEII